MAIHHGIKYTEQNNAARVLKMASTAIIGLIATAHDADATFFPANTPVYVSDIEAFIAKAGTAGTLKKSLLALTEICRPQIIVVRVPDTAEAPADAQDIIGDVDANGHFTGIKALQSAKTLTGMTPKIIGTPGFNSVDVNNELGAIGAKIRAFGYFKTHAENIADALTELNSYSHKNLMAIFGDTNETNGDAVARAMGLRARLDMEYGFVQKSISNVPIDGVNSVTKPISWDISGIGTNAAALNDGNITAIIRNNGFRFWGNRTPSDDANFAFETWVRTDYAVKDMIDAAEFGRIDLPLTPNLINATLSELNAKARQMMREGHVMFLQFTWDGTINPPSELSQGRAKIRYDLTPVSPWESIEFLPQISGEFYVGFGNL